jgi:FAD/FMN-containing dehydrogenase
MAPTPRPAGSVTADLARIVGAEHVVDGADAGPLPDATEARGLVPGRPAAVVRPGSTAEVAAVVRHCCAAGLALVPRGGATGLAGGAVPTGGEVVVELARLRAVRRFDPGLWRIEAEAGLPTAHLHRLAREHGLRFGPDPGAAEQSQVGGMVATNAGGPHAFGLGVMRDWVTGLEAVVPPGDVVRPGGPLRKDVAGYDLVGLLVGSEGTLGIVTAAWLRLEPAPEAAVGVVAACADAAAGCAAVLDVLAAGLRPTVLDVLDEAAAAAAGGAFPLGDLGTPAPFVVLAEAEGTTAEAARGAEGLRDVLAGRARAVVVAATPADTRALWRWRDGVSLAVAAQHGGKLGEDVAVPVERVADLVRETRALGARHDLPTATWGHAGDGNLHATFLVDRTDAAALGRAGRAADELLAWAAAQGGTVTGEHGVGLVKRGGLARQWDAPTVALHRAVKRAIDPDGLMNPGKKEA